MQARLLPAVRAGKEALSQADLDFIKTLSGPRPVRFLLEVVKTWVSIGLAVWVALVLDHALVTALALLFVATRQNVLGLLVHDQTHASFGGRFGDWVANLLCAYPILVLTVEGYARVHLAHHRDYFGPRDPDHLRKSGPEWTFPKSRWELARLFATDLLGLNTLKVLKGKQTVPAGTPEAPRKGQVPRWLRPVFLVTLLGAVTLLGIWPQFLLFWVLPLVTVLPAIVRWGALCEHEYNREGADMLGSTPLIIQPWSERLLLPMLNFGLHPYHHLFPAVSFSQLPAVHEAFERAGLVQGDRVFHGSRAYWRFLVAQ